MDEKFLADLKADKHLLETGVSQQSIDEAKRIAVLHPINPYINDNLTYFKNINEKINNTVLKSYSDIANCYTELLVDGVKKIIMEKINKNPVTLSYDVDSNIDPIATLVFRYQDVLILNMTPDEIMNILDLKPLVGQETSNLHLMWMLQELLDNEEQSLTKKHRWMGCVQGIMIAKGYINVPEERELTRDILNGA